ncbi:helix-turn-helix domain-containing protein, partial [Leuconostoc falkenbergense]
YSQNHTVKATAEAFNISPRTVQYTKKLFNQDKI